MRRRILLAAWLGVAVLPAIPGGTHAQEVKAKMDLWNQGTLLRGANLWQKALFKDEEPFIYVGMETCYRPENIERMRKVWNANYINLSCPGLWHADCDGNGKYPSLPAIRNDLVKLVRLAAKHELFVVIAFRTGPGRTEDVFSGGNDKDHLFRLDDKTQLTKEARRAQAAWVKMWEEAAAVFKDEPNVIGYDLLVEPWTKPEQDSGQKKPRRGNRELSIGQIAIWRDFALSMAKAIRQVDQTTPILVGPAPYNEAAALARFPATPFQEVANVVIAVHQYEPFNYTHQDCPTRYSDGHRKQLHCLYACMADYTKENKCALTVNEFGAYRWAGALRNPDAHVFLKEQLALLEKQGRNHALWLWEVDKIDYYDHHFRLGVDKGRTKEPAPADDPLVNLIKKNWKANRIFATDDVLNKWKK